MPYGRRRYRRSRRYKPRRKRYSRTRRTRYRRARNRNIRRVVNRMAERKYREELLFNDQTGLQPGATAAGPQVRAVYQGIAQGYENDERVGNKIHCTSINLGIYVDWKDSTVDAGYPTDYVGRLVIVNWKSGRTQVDLATDNIPTPDEIFAWTGDNCIYSPFVTQDKGRGRFEVLYDRTFVNNASIETTAVNTQKVVLRHTLRVNRDVWYASANTDIVKNQIYFIWVSDNPNFANNGVSLTMFTRVNYTDI